jgi:hypothetical protein
LVGLKTPNNGSFASKYSLLASEPLFRDLSHRSLAPPIADAREASSGLPTQIVQ